MSTCLLLALALTPGPAAEPQITRLDNALTVITVEDHALPLVSVQLWFHTGSAADNPAQPGLCHIARTLLEHHDDAALKLRAAGVRFEGRTDYDAISFCSVLPPNFLEYVLKIEAGRLRRFEVSANELRGATNAAARETQFSVSHGLLAPDRRLREALFADHPYRHRFGIVAASLEQLRPADMRDFLSRWIVPGNATLFIIGDIKHEDALKLARKHFDALPWREPPRAPMHELPPAEKLEPIRIYGERGEILIAWLAPPTGYFENAAYHVLMQRLCNEVDGLLTRRLREAGFKIPPGWQHAGSRDASVLALRLVLPISHWRLPRTSGEDTDATDSTATAREMLRILDEALTEAAETAPLPIEFDRARALELLRLRQNRANFSARAVWRANSEVVAGNVLIEDRVESRVRTLGVDNIREAALRLQSARRAVVIVAPELEPSPIPPLSPLLEPKAPERLDSGAVLQLLARHAVDAPMPGTPTHTPNIRERQISTGITAIVCRAPGLPAVAVNTCAERPSTLMRTRVDSVLDRDGTSRHTSDELRDYASVHGISLGVIFPPGWNGYACTGAPEHTPQMIELQAEMLKAALRPDESSRIMPSIRIVVVGDIAPDDAFEDIKHHWQSWTTAARGANDNQPPDKFTVHASGDESPTTWVHVGVRRTPPSSATARGLLAWKATARLLGCPHSEPDVLGRDRRACWQTDYLGADLMALNADSPHDCLLEDIRGLAKRLVTQRCGRIPPAEIETALRLARMDRLQHLGSVEAIAGELLTYQSAPWDMAADLDSKALRASWSNAGAIQLEHVWLSGGNVDDALANEVHAILEPLGKPQSEQP